MRKLSILSILLVLSITAYAQQEAYVIYNADGKKVSFDKMAGQLESQDIILFGELHNNPIAHWLQLELTKTLSEYRKLILGAEMLETDNQVQLNKYLKGSIDYKKLKKTARLWPNYKTDYAPLVNFAKKNKLPFVATNIPRRYARVVHKKGFEGLDSLSLEEKSWIAPLPIPFDSELPTYKKIIKMMGSHGSARLVMAQAIKDATMAYFILDNFTEGNLFIHYNGAFHSDYYEGILWYLRQERDDLNYATISTVTQEDIYELEKDNYYKADFIICVDKDMTTTY